MMDYFNDNVYIVRDVDMIDKYVAKMEQFIGEFFSLGTRMKCILSCRLWYDVLSWVGFLSMKWSRTVLAMRLKREIWIFHNDFVWAQNDENAWSWPKQLTNAENLRSDIFICYNSVETTRFRSWSRIKLSIVNSTVFLGSWLHLRHLLIHDIQMFKTLQCCEKNSR